MMSNYPYSKQLKAPILDAKLGKIDRIITKSVSRFGRNTVDNLQAVRELNAIGVDIFFETENMHSSDPTCEMIFTLMSSMAQEESRNISKNVSWGVRERMKQGSVTMAYKSFLGYRKGEDGKPEIDPEEAKIIRKIFQMCLDGYTLRNIAGWLEDNSIKTPKGNTKWSVQTVKNILSNEKYKGDCLRQKTYTVDYLTKKKKKNNGELAQYYIENSHPAIIDRTTFELVQEELRVASLTKNSRTNNSPLSTKIICEDCGSFYGHKVFHGDSPNRTDVWYCNKKYNKKNPCSTPIIREDIIKERFLEALHDLLKEKDTLLADSRRELIRLKDVSDIDKKIDEAEIKLEDLEQEAERLIERNMRIIQDQAEYQKKYNAVSEKIHELEDQIQDLETEKMERRTKHEKLFRFISVIDEYEEKDSFDADIWRKTIDKVYVSKNRELRFEFKDGTQITKDI